MKQRKFFVFDDPEMSTPDIISSTNLSEDCPDEEDFWLELNNVEEILPDIFRWRDDQGYTYHFAGDGKLIEIKLLPEDLICGDNR